MSTEKGPKPELPFKQVDTGVLTEIDLSQILTRETRSFNFGSEKDNGNPVDFHEIEGQHGLTNKDNGPVIIEFKNGTLYYSSKSVGRETIDKIRDDIPLDLAKKVCKKEKLTDKEIGLIEEGRF